MKTITKKEIIEAIRCSGFKLAQNIHTHEIFLVCKGENLRKNERLIR
jgi:hypothetical protein